MKLFRIGRAQAVRIPREFELPYDEAIMRKVGERLIIEPATNREAIRELLDRWAKEGPIDEEWPEIDDPPPERVDF